MTFKDGNKHCDYTGCRNVAIDRFGMDDDSKTADLCGEHWHGYIVAVHTGTIPQPHLVCKKCGKKVQMNPNVFSQYMMNLDNRDHHRPVDPFYLCPNCHVTGGGGWASGSSGTVVFAVSRSFDSQVVSSPLTEVKA